MSRRTILMALAAGMLAASIQAQDGVPVIFIPMTPCRMVDTRFDSSGGPITGAVRNLTMTGAAYSGVPVSKACTAVTGAPASASSVQLNFTLANMTGQSDLRVAPWGTAPVDSIMNSNAGFNLAQEAIETVASNGAGQQGISVLAGGTSFNLIVDVLGYFTTSFRNNNQYVNILENTTNNGYAIYAINPSTNCGGDCGFVIWTESPIGNTTIDAINTDGGAEANTGVQASVSSTGDGSKAIVGNAFGGTGVTNGVFGQTFSISSMAGGVEGRESSGPAPGATFLNPAGVRGNSNTGYGVSGTSTFCSVSGYLFDGAGTFVAEGDLGYNGYGEFSFGNTGATGTKFFVEPHPTDASKEIRYISLEGPESGTYFRGTGRIVNGFARIDVPESFRLVTDTDGMTFVATPVGSLAVLAVISQDLNTIVVQGSKDVAFHYVVNGVRKAFKGFQPISENRDFIPQGPDDHHFPLFSAEAQRRLVATGIYTAEGKVNMDTARTMGWAQTWAERDARTKALAEAGRAEAAARVQANSQKVVAEQQ